MRAFATSLAEKNLCRFSQFEAILRPESNSPLPAWAQNFLHQARSLLIAQPTPTGPLSGFKAYVRLGIGHILFVVIEVAELARGRVGLIGDKPGRIAFSFGPLHGLGFASALNETG